MTTAPSSCPRGVELLEGGVACLVPVLSGIEPADLVRPTPCRGWDLATLLLHLAEGVDTLTTCLPDEYPCEDPGPLRSIVDLEERCRRMLAAWTAAADDGSPELLCSWDGVLVPHRIVARVGTLELTVHAWDVARALAGPAPSAEGLATELLRWAPTLLGESSSFAHPRPWAADAPAVERLVAATGRDPRWHPADTVLPRRRTRPWATDPA